MRRNRSFPLIRATAVFGLALAALAPLPSPARAQQAGASDGETVLEKHLRLQKQQMLEPEHATEVAVHRDGGDTTPPFGGTVTIDPVPPLDRGGLERPDFFATIQDGGFYIDGERRFLLGAEGSSTIYPYLYHLMGFDFAVLGDAYKVVHWAYDGDDPEALADGRVRKIACGKHGENDWHVSWGVDPYYAIEVDKLLDVGIMPYVALMERGKPERMPLFAAFPRMFAERGHFLSYSPLNPTGEKIRWNNRKSVMGGLGDRPVWAWEMFNEVSYRSHDQWNLDAFREWAEAHYGTIERANAAWQTDFDGFAAVEPPNPGYFVMARGTTFKPEWSRPLFYDFMRSQEIVFGDYGVRSLHKMHELDPLGYVTVQSHCSLPSDYGNIGVNPFLKAQGEDIYGAEVMQYLAYQGENDPGEIVGMLKPVMVYDTIRAAAGDRPILGEESTLNGRGGPKLASRTLAEMKGTWQFLPLEGADGPGADLQPPDADAPGWTTIEVPGIWGKLGFADTQMAWYRRAFELPARSEVLGEGQQLLLQAGSLADHALVFVNGKQVYETKKWNEGFGVDLGDIVNWGGTNVVSIWIENHYNRSGFYWGGIRGHVSLVVGQPWHPQPMGPGQMRTWIWSKAAHGYDGSVISYFYNNAAFKDYYPPFSPYYRTLDALKAIAPVGKTIDNLASIVLPEAQRGRVALVYPMTSLRSHLAENYRDYISGPLTAHLTRYYGALLFNHVPLDVVIDEDLPDLNRYEAIVVALEPRITAETLDRLERYARQGGVLMIGADSLTTNGDNYAPLGEIAWLPDRDQTGADQSGKAVGKGYVYMLSADASLPELHATLDALLKRSHIEPELTVKATGEAPASYLEAQAFTGDEGRTVWYLLNWGAATDAVIGSGSSAFEPGQTYRVRDAAADKIIHSPTGEAMWTGEQLREGMALTVPCQDPMVLLIEESGMKPLPLPTISSELTREIDEAFSPTIQSEQRILFSAVPTNARMTPVRIPTAEKVMEKMGWGVYLAMDPIDGDEPMPTWGGAEITPRPLGDFQVLVYSCPQGNIGLPAEQIEDVKRYVANGGGLLLLANPPHGPHGWLSSNTISSLSEAFGVKVVDGMIRDAEHARDEYALLPVLSNIGDHPITAGVESYDPDGTAWLQIQDGSPARAVIRTYASSEPANAPVVVVLEYGKGRVVVMGSGYWLEPTIFDNADNQRLLVNIMKWLAPRASDRP